MSRNYAKHLKTKALIFFDEKPPVDVSVPNDWALHSVPPGGMGPFTRLVGEDPDQRLCRMALPHVPDDAVTLRARIAQIMSDGLPKLDDSERARLESIVYHTN